MIPNLHDRTRAQLPCPCQHLMSQAAPIVSAKRGQPESFFQTLTSTDGIFRPSKRRRLEEAERNPHVVDVEEDDKDVASQTSSPVSHLRSVSPTASASANIILPNIVGVDRMTEQERKMRDQLVKSVRESRAPLHLSYCTFVRCRNAAGPWLLMADRHLTQVKRSSQKLARFGFVVDQHGQVVKGGFECDFDNDPTNSAKFNGLDIGSDYVLVSSTMPRAISVATKVVSNGQVVHSRDNASCAIVEKVLDRLRQSPMRILGTTYNDQLFDETMRLEMGRDFEPGRPLPWSGSPFACTDVFSPLVNNGFAFAWYKGAATYSASNNIIKPFGYGIMVRKSSDRTKTKTATSVATSTSTATSIGRLHEMIDGDSQVYVGQYKDGREHGIGALKSKSTIVFGRWEEGILKSGNSLVLAVNIKDEDPPKIVAEAVHVLKVVDHHSLMQKLSDDTVYAIENAFYDPTVMDMRREDLDDCPNAQAFAAAWAKLGITTNRDQSRLVQAFTRIA
ncbi:hypothetical protein ml_437 [Mollivirus sibericum]|uniref:hypothetical protein n=1 Tax=Mollivirus sibericum TaxID=1678078 RepID=UPI0006B2EFC5|nr:hypothetical protein ml_437 [Mollivirus sibericum]ALD62239.1 hypothetical protein ml_437 [Mollivirus sibericum]